MNNKTPDARPARLGYFVQRNGRRVSPFFATEAEAARWALAHPAPQKARGRPRKH